MTKHDPLPIDAHRARFLELAAAGPVVVTSPTGSGTVTGPVSVTVKNVASNTTASLGGGFLYKAAMQITAVGPGSGSYLGGTRLTIDGIGFVAPVTVTVAGPYSPSDARSTLPPRRWARSCIP